MMDTILYWLARGLIAVLQRVPIRLVAVFGRSAGALAYVLDARHRRVALHNLTRCFHNEKSPREIRALVRENFRRIGENFACAAKAATLPNDRIPDILRLEGAEKIRRIDASGCPHPAIFAVGHFGNFELYARSNVFLPGAQYATTFRGLRHPRLNGLLRKLRERSGCWYFERRSGGSELKAALQHPGLLVGFLCDQHAGDRGLHVPFFNIPASTSAAAALFALRYRCPLHTAVCFRARLGQWVVEIGDEIPTRTPAGAPRSPEEITHDINRIFEAAVRRDPANWFWVHNRWKSLKTRRRTAQSERSRTHEPARLS